MSGNPLLYHLACGHNALKELDISSNTAISCVDCEHNQLTYLDIGNNSNIRRGVTEGTLMTYEDPDIYSYGIFDPYEGYGDRYITINYGVVILLDGNPFEDVKKGKYYFVPVMWAFYNDPPITTGTDDTHFSPGDTCTRGQVVTFLWRANGCPEPEITENPFVDVKESAFYYKAVLWALENKITTGTDPTHFSPKDECTRAQVVTFMYRASGTPEIESSECPFQDVKESGFYYKAMLWAVEKNITTGTSATTFSPSDSCTRGQTATFLYRNRAGK